VLELLRPVAFASSFASPRAETGVADYQTLSSDLQVRLVDSTPRFQARCPHAPNNKLKNPLQTLLPKSSRLQTPNYSADQRAYAFGTPIEEKKSRYEGGEGEGGKGEKVGGGGRDAS